MLTGEDRIIPHDDLLKRLAAADAHVLLPVMRSDGSETERRRDTVFRVLATLYFLIVFFRLDVQYSPLRVVMIKWKAFGAGQGAEPNALFAVKVRTLMQRKLQGDGSFSDQDLRFVMSDLMAAGNMTPTPLELCCTCMLTVLTSQHMAANRTSDLVGVVLNRLRRDAAEATLAMMAPFLRRQLVCSPFVDLALIEDGIASFRAFHLWPQPLCSITLDMLRTLSMETKSPGVTWRRALEKGFPALKGRPATGFELACFVFVAPESSLANVLSSVTVRVPSEREVTSAAVLAIFQSLGVGETEADEMAAAAEVPQMQFLSLKKLRGVYSKVRECLQQSIQMSNVPDAMSFLLARLEHLYKALLKHVAREQGRCKGVAPFPPNPPSSLVLCGLPRQYQIVRMSFDCALAGREPGSKWPRRNALKPLRETVADMVRAFVPGGKRLTARILVEGGDNELHHMLGAYVAVLQSDPDVASKIKFRFFLLPNSAAPRRMCASYLCSVDPWFAKTVAVGLKGPVACAGGLDQNTSTSVPAVAGAATVAETMIDTSFRLPPLFLHSLLNDYMMARHANQLMVFQCECWQKSVSNAEAPSKYVIPFFLSAEIGLAAQARSFQMLNDLPLTLSVADIAGCKAFRFKAPVLSAKMVSVSLRGASKPEPELEARPWSEIYIGVIPQTGTHCDTPRPSSSTMEMFAAAAGDPVSGAPPAGKKQRSRNQFRFHIKSIEIEGHNKSTFDVLLDGVCYGPFVKVCIAPCMLGDAQMTFPLMSFNNVSEFQEE